MKFVKVLERLSNACGVAGREDEVRVLMKDLLKPNVDEIQEDRLGNVIGVRRGMNDSPKVMVAAHMDEVGLFKKSSFIPQIDLSLESLDLSRLIS